MNKIEKERDIKKWKKNLLESGLPEAFESLLDNIRLKGIPQLKTQGYHNLPKQTKLQTNSKKGHKPDKYQKQYMTKRYESFTHIS